MNAVTSSSKSTGTFKWLLKREFWENRGGFLWAPVITGGIFTFLYLLLAVIGSISGREALQTDGILETPEKVQQAIGLFGDLTLLTGISLAAVVLAFVVFFYSLGALYDDRRDRSILFWKSLPLSDTQMVLSKAAWALLLAPVLALAVGVVIGVAMWVISALTLTVNGLPAASSLFTHSHPFRIIGGVLASLPVYIIWALPTVGWLMFCSAWARSKPFLWAVLLPVLACVIVSMTDILPGIKIPHDVLWYTIAYRGLLSVVPGTWYAAVDQSDIFSSNGVDSLEELAGALNLTSSWHAFASADIWIGAAIGIALIFAAIRLRRYRDLTD